MSKYDFTIGEQVRINKNLIGTVEYYDEATGLLIYKILNNTITSHVTQVTIEPLVPLAEETYDEEVPVEAEVETPKDELTTAGNFLVEVPVEAPAVEETPVVEVPAKAGK